MSEKLTQEQLNEWSYPLKSELEENEEKKKQAQQSFNQSNEHLNEDAKQAINTLDKKEKLDEQIKVKQSELDEFKNPKAKREFIKEKLDGIENDDNLRESLKILKKKEKIDEQIQEKQAELNEFKSPKEKRELVKEKLDAIDKNDDLKESLEILKAKEKEIEEKGKEAPTEQNKGQDQQDQGNSAEQEDWNKKADELEKQHEKELEKLKDEQSRLEANFQKSIDNLMNSDGINGIITALQEMDRSLEMMLKQGREESEKKEKQRQEKLELAFDSPKFKEAVGDLVKEVYAQRKEVQSGLKEMENEHANYAKLKTAYEKEVKNGLDVKGHEKLSKMMGDIEKETPNFKEAYPKFYKKVNDTLDQAKDKIKNKILNNQDKGREI
ncbi:Uncharacterised protein [Campylobacter hyointestinalis subsp. hyointestinalis]|uniref:Uncharacterized protein n=1 Tax=Campylobacter hyointestinalis subsp. hyointestinalis TaxID=91352 RepID=A0A9W5AS73_CAMHY|nr:hypothetical protein [Campylobacter hyointestinalis]CUU72361.1 Uncharacterised protein [Campylobacter hyointestinalis subsp. hyointestinalis]CUU72379.1 Uncharacterised protein [Campylobacter hyointestinalis subsp. hyointestinalis]CUU84601.1 Uncharacterised protein [Campylobacter hyointestinalis subsp. hyointestinalis]